MPCNFLEDLAKRGWVIETNEDRSLILEEVIGRRAVLAYMPIYTHVTGRGPLTPDECDLFLQERRCAGGHVLRFIYDHLGEKLTFEVVPNTENKTAQVRAVTTYLGNETKSQWLKFAKKFV